MSPIHTCELAEANETIMRYRVTSYLSGED